MNLLTKTATALAVLVALSACDRAEMQEADLAVIHTSIIDVETGEILPDQTILMKDGKITSVEPSESASFTAETVVNGRDHFAIPGIWDMHVHFRGGNTLIEENRALLPLYTSWGVTGMRDAGGDISPVVLSWRTAIDNQIMTGPKIFTSGPKLDGTEPAWDGSISVVTREDVNTALDQLQGMGVDYVKTYDGNLSRDAYLAILEEAQNRGIKVSGHMPMTVMLEEAVDRNLGSVEHLYYLVKGTSPMEAELTGDAIARDGTDDPQPFRATMEIYRSTFDAARADEIMEKMAAKGTYVTPTLHIGTVLNELNDVDHTGDPELALIGEGIKATYAKRVEGAAKASPAARKMRNDLDAHFQSMIRLLRNAGVSILAGSDGGAFNSYVYPGIAIHREMAALESVGLTPLQALQAATINGARFFGIEDQYGSLATGKAADLLLLRGNPLIDIRNTQEIACLIQGGHFTSGDDLRALRGQ